MLSAVRNNRNGDLADKFRLHLKDVIDKIYVLIEDKSLTIYFRSGKMKSIGIVEDNIVVTELDPVMETAHTFAERYCA